MIDIHWRAKSGTERERKVLECAKGYGCEPNTHLFDRLLGDMKALFAVRAAKVAELAIRDAEIAEERRKLAGG